MSDRKPLMPKATAVWLVENTSLTFEQVAELCGLHVLEVKGIADGDVAAAVFLMSVKIGLALIVSGAITDKNVNLL